MTEGQRIGWETLQAGDRLLRLQWPLLPLENDPLVRLGEWVCPVHLQWTESLNKGNTACLRCFIPQASGAAVADFPRLCVGQLVHLFYAVGDDLPVPARGPDAGAGLSFPDASGSVSRHHVAMVVSASLQGESQGLVWFELRLQDSFSALAVGRRYRAFCACDLPTLTDRIYQDWCARQAWFSQCLTIDFAGVRLASSSPERAFVLQYGESDYDFLRRQWAEAGWHWHIEARHVNSSWTQVLCLYEGVAAWPEPRSVPYHRTRESDAFGAIDTFSVCRTFQPGVLQLLSTDYKQPGPALVQRIPVGSSPWSADVPIAQHWLGSGHGDQASVFWQRADVLHQQVQSLQWRGQGEGNARYLGVGRRIQFQSEPPDTGGAAGALIADSVGASVGGWAIIELSCEVSNLLSGQIVGDRAGAAPYRNQFKVLAADGPLNGPPGSDPPPPPCPGPLTARVIGLPTESPAECNGQVRSDSWGRVRVRFPFAVLSGAHHDPAGSGQLPMASGDLADSAWLRVTQASAGGGGGHLFLPRVGDEVLVQFLHGHPDRPVIVGSLYNADSRPVIFSDENLPGFETLSGSPPPAQSGMPSPGSMFAQSGIRALALPATGGSGRALNALSQTLAAQQGSELVFNSAADKLSVALGCDLASARLSLGSLLPGPGPQGYALSSAAHGVIKASLGLHISTGSPDPLQLLASAGPDAATAKGQVLIHSASDLIQQADRHIHFTALGGMAAEVGGDAIFKVGGALRCVLKQGVDLSSDGGGVCLRAGASDLSLIAAAGACSMAANGGVSITSSNGSISLRAAQSIELLAGGARLRLSNGGIQLHAPGVIELRRAGQLQGGPVGHATRLPDLPTDSHAHGVSRRLLRCLSLEGQSMPGHRIVPGPLSEDGLHGKALMGTGVWTRTWLVLDEGPAGGSTTHVAESESIADSLVAGECPVEY